MTSKCFLGSLVFPFKEFIMTIKPLEWGFKNVVSIRGNELEKVP